MRLTPQFALNGLIAIALTSSVAKASEWSHRGNVSLQQQLFTKDSLHEADQSANTSLSGEVELYREIGENGSVTITPFARVDQNDDERTHFDLRELLYTHLGDGWEVRAGLGKVFWGVAESVNKVDVINQFDDIENSDSSAKLGQAMVNLLLMRDWGDIDLYILPGFRKATFAGIDGRPRAATVIDTENALYESDDEEQHIDVAARVSGVLGDFDVGAHVFHGTARSPLLQFNQASSSLVPFYYQHTQIGLDIQATLESWLLKGEAVYQNGDMLKDHAELVTGFEYSFYDIKGSGADIGIVAEWLYDSREDDASQPFQNDALIGIRVALNDEQSLEGLMGLVTDFDGRGQLLSLEGSRRLGNAFKVSLRAQLYLDTDNDPFLNGFKNEDHMQLDLAYFF